MRSRRRWILVLFASVLWPDTPIAAQTDTGPSSFMPPTLAGRLQPGSLPGPEALSTEDQVVQPPDGRPPTPRHTGMKAMVKELGHDLKALPSRENLFWVGVGSGLALAAHQFDTDVNRSVVGSDTAKRFSSAGETMGELPTLLGGAGIIYAVGRLRDQPRVSHVGMDLIRAVALAEGLTQALKYTTRRERPDGSGLTSFPSGHAADTFAFATALERHLNWRLYVPAYAFSSYVAFSRLPQNRHWLSDTVFGAAVGIIAGRTATGHETAPYPVEIASAPGGAAVMFMHEWK